MFTDMRRRFELSASQLIFSCSIRVISCPVRVLQTLVNGSEILIVEMFHAWVFAFDCNSCLDKGIKLR